MSSIGEDLRFRLCVATQRNGRAAIGYASEEAAYEEAIGYASEEAAYEEAANRAAIGYAL